MERKETKNQVIVSFKDKTEVWEKNSAGCTTKGGHSSQNHKTGTVTNHYGRTIGNTKKGK